MSEPASGFFALLVALFLGGAGDGTAEVKPQPNPVHASGKPVCTMELVTRNGRHEFTVLVAAPDRKVSGRYVLKLDGRGTNSVTVHDERKLVLDPGETEVLSALDLDAGTRLSGHIEFRDSKGAVLCQDSL